MTSKPPNFGGDAAALTDLVRQQAARIAATRLIIGLTGGPGSGKTTLADRMCEELTRGGETAVVVPMDGFHLAQRELARLELTEVKGSPKSFDADGYLTLMHRLRSPADHVVYAPAFDRTLEEPVAGSIAVAPDVRYIITEGNYLLLDAEPWQTVRALLDACWFVDPGEDIRVNRLVRRHIHFGRTPNVALRRATSGSDATNAELIAPTVARADLVITT